MKISVYSLLLVILFLGACGGGEKPVLKEKGEQKVSKVYPAFNGDSAFNFVKRQVDFGPRVPNTEASIRCATWMMQTLQRYTPHVQVQQFKARAYNGLILNGRNIIASFNLDAKARILLASHWDSRPYADHDPDPANHRKPIDGANDGASGVGVLLELARIMHQHTPSIGVDIVLFDAEDYGPQ